MAPEQRPRSDDENYDIEDVLKKLDELDRSVSSDEERHDVRQARRVAERVPGSKRISKYTTRDVSEGAVGAIVFSLPLLVEDGVFDIAVSFVVAGAMMALWGRLHAGEPTGIEAFARITVVWAAATLGATIADILPGESAGTDIRDRIADIGDGDGSPGRR